MAPEALEAELKKLRSNADGLAQCLGSLLNRIEQLEQEHSANVLDDYATSEATAQMLQSIAATLSADSRRNFNQIVDESEVVRKEYVTVDPVTGVRKRTIVTESVIGNEMTQRQREFGKGAKIKRPSTFNGEQLKALNVKSEIDDLNKAFYSRVVSLSAQELQTLTIEFHSGQPIVMKVPPGLTKSVHAGDTILEISGQPAVRRKQFFPPFVDDLVTLKLALSNLYSLPMDFCKILEDRVANDVCAIGGSEEPKACSSNGGPSLALPYLSFSVKTGDVLQVISTDKFCLQARKVDDLSQVGYVPLNIRMERIALLNPFGRRVLVLLGASGTGRRTLKSMLLERFPNHFATTVPVTSRIPKPGEVSGREYEFMIKEDILKLIRANQMIEWGELQGQLYGTSADSVRQIIRSGRMCVLDCEERALKRLYTREYMPYVVVITPPPLEELIQVKEMRQRLEQRTPVTVDREVCRITCEESERLMTSYYRKYFHLVLVNRNFDVTLRRLTDALENLKNNAQWIPSDWLN